ncbi:30S ribosomal protein S21 [Sediminibacterium sp. Gen4]|jgi:small subunit ribosomal protein S21|nr:30S ribosomal protein S21 [Sediminibacterium sp. Gen4]
MSDVGCLIKEMHLNQTSDIRHEKIQKGFVRLNHIPIFALLKNTRGGIIVMLIIDSKDCENIDKALKKYKKKFEKSKVLLQLRERQAFTKPSVRRRGEVLKAIYKQQIASGKIEG